MSSKVGGIARAPVWGANPFRILFKRNYEKEVNVQLAVAGSAPPRDKAVERGVIRVGFER